MGKEGTVTGRTARTLIFERCLIVKGYIFHVWLYYLQTDTDAPGRSTTPSFHPASIGVTLSHTSIPTPAPITTNVSSQLISRLTSPLINSTTTSNSIAAVATVTASSPVTSGNVEVATVCPFHLHHHHQQFHHQHHNTSSSGGSIACGGNAGISTSATSLVNATPVTVTNFVNGTTVPHTHTHHHHNCFAGGVTAATTNNGGTATAGISTNGHHYHTHHRHVTVGTGNNPTDLSVKKCAGNGSTERPTALKYSLSQTEVNAVKQLIAGYRESAAFLLRSADELEQLLLQQN